MKPGRPFDGLLRWYPATWRDRYGDELTAAIEDDLDGRQPTLRFRWSIVTAGLRERALAGGVFGRSAPVAERTRTGVVLVLSGWTAFIFAGAVFAKVSEHFAGALAYPHRAVPQREFDIVQIAAAIAGACTLLAVAVVLPSFWRFLRAGGWPAVRTRVRRAVALTFVTGAAVAGIAPWAHSLSAASRNGANAAYGAVFVAWALLVAATLVLWAHAAVGAFRKLHLGPRPLTAVSVLAVLVGAAMATVTVAAAVWWSQVALDAPWFFHGTPMGSQGSAFDATLASAMAVMLAAVVLAQYGVGRIVRSQVELARSRR